MAPPPTHSGGHQRGVGVSHDDGWQVISSRHNKQMRNIKRSRDRDISYKKDIAQDLWGRQRGGRVGRWEKKLLQNNAGRGGGRLGVKQVLDSVSKVEDLEYVPSGLQEEPVMDDDEGEPMLYCDQPSPGGAVASVTLTTSADDLLQSVCRPRVLFHVPRRSSPAAAARSVRFKLQGGRRTSEAIPLMRGVSTGVLEPTIAVEGRLNRSSTWPRPTPLPLPPESPSSSEFFKSELPALTPTKTKSNVTGFMGSASRSCSTPQAPALSRDSVLTLIFEALFGRRQVKKGPKESFGGAWDESDGSDDEGENVDEGWIKNSMEVSLFSSKALEFACSSTRGTDLLAQYVDVNAVCRLVNDLRIEDPRVPSPRLAVLKAIHEHCPPLRLPMARAAAAAAHDRLCLCRNAVDRARLIEVDPNAGSGRDQGQTLLELLQLIVENLPTCYPNAAPAYVWPDGDLGAVLRELLRLFGASLRCLGAAVGDPLARTGEGGCDAGSCLADELQLLRGVIPALLAFAPCVTSLVLRELSASWPVGSVARETAFLALAGTVLSSAPPLCPEAAASLFRRISKCIKSPCVKVASAAGALIAEPSVLHGYLQSCRPFMQACCAALADNRKHWNASVREASEQSFDMLLDFC